MNRISLATAGYELVIKRTCKCLFFDEMHQVARWMELISLNQPFAFSGTTTRGGGPSFPVEGMLRFHFLQWWFGLSDPTMKKALHDASLYCEFVWLEPGSMRLPDESAILRFYHLLEENRFSIQMLATINATLVVKWPTLKCGKVVDATRLAALRAIKNSGGEPGPEMGMTKEVNLWEFGMESHFGVEACSDFGDIVIGTLANVNDVTPSHGWLHEEKSVMFVDAGYPGATKRSEANGVEWQVAMLPGKRRAP